MPASKKVKQDDTEIEESWIATSTYVLTTKGGLVPVSTLKAEEKKEGRKKRIRRKKRQNRQEQPNRGKPRL